MAYLPFVNLTTEVTEDTENGLTIGSSP